ncbi:MAG: homoserine dehydrogenase [Chloroflexota bacterium]
MPNPGAGPALSAAPARNASLARGDAALRVAVLGGGTVGREVVRGLLASPDRLVAPGAPRIELAGIAVRDIESARARGLPADALTDAPAHLVADPATDVVVELMGGDEPARTLVAAALSAGKSVVTANKHVIAHHGAELEAIARGTGAPLRFEAAVGGGIPVLGPLAGDLAANRFERVRGIVNGTTNYILSAMADGRGTYESVLREAQDQGYAEADPSGDVEGRDAINKLVILARLAFGAWLDPERVVDRPPSLHGTGGPGITGVTTAELEAAAALGLSIRLIATATGGTESAIEASVIPMAVPADSPLGRTGGVRNRIEVTGTPVGTVGFDGPGAGGEATSSAVLGDIAAIARGAGSTWAALPAAGPAASATAPDPAGWTRRWFGFLPGVTAGRVLLELAEAHAEMPSGTAVRTTWLGLESLRSRILEVAPESLDAPWYPIDD